MDRVLRKTTYLSCVRALLIGSFVSTLAGCASAEAPLLQSSRSTRPLSDGTASRVAVTDSQQRPLPDVPENADLAAYLRYAELHHPSLRSAGLRWEAARQQAPQDRSLPDPSLNVGYESMNRETRVGVSQMIPFPGKQQLRGNVADAGADVARQQIQVQRREVLRRVAEAYAEYVYVTQAERLIAQNVELARQLEEVALARVRGGGPQADVLRAQIELARVEDELRTTQDLHRPAVARLNAALGRHADATVPPPVESKTAMAVASDEELVVRLRQENPELLALQAEAEQARIATTLARRENYPDFMIGLDYMRDPMESGVGAMLSITLPIWQQRNRAAIRQSNYSFYAAQQALIDRQNALEADLQMALYNRRDAERKIALYSETLLPRARQSLASTQAAYRAAAVDFLTLVEAYRLPLEFELALARAEADRVQRLAEIRALVGGFLEATSDRP